MTTVISKHRHHHLTSVGELSRLHRKHSKQLTTLILRIDEKYKHTYDKHSTILTQGHYIGKTKYVVFTTKTRKTDYMVQGSYACITCPPADEVESSKYRTANVGSISNLIASWWMWCITYSFRSIRPFLRFLPNATSSTFCIIA